METGVVIANPSSIGARVDLELLAADWTPLNRHETVSLGPRETVSLFLRQIPGFGDLDSGFSGIIRIQGPSALASGFKRTFRTTDDLVTTPLPSLIDPADSSRDSTFLFVVQGSGYTTQLINVDPSTLVSP
jgi:hypothetical protein